MVKRAIISWICLAALIATSSSYAVVSETGKWSETINGIQGRLIVSEDPMLNGTRILAAYVELRNVSDVMNPLEIYYEPGSMVQCQLRDATGKPISRADLPASIIQPLPFWLTLPHDSSLRFRISVSGYGIPKDARALIPMADHAWLIKAGDQNEYALEATFIARRPKDETHERRVWQGVLKLPKVKIPA